MVDSGHHYGKTRCGTMFFLALRTLLACQPRDGMDDSAGISVDAAAEAILRFILAFP